MTVMRRTRCALAMFMLLAVSAGAQVIDRSIAVVNHKLVTWSELDAEMRQHLNHGGGEAALWEDGRALHEQHDVVRCHFLADPLKYRVV